MTSEGTRTEVGSYFISNYPPFSQWTSEGLEAVRAAFAAPPRGVPLGLYLHIPFCRRRCKFCYFRVYTDKNAHDVERYLAALAREIELVSHLEVMGGRPFRFVYFGGGTPSYISARQLESLVARIEQHARWDQAEEVTFECEPGTLSLPKLQTLRQLGITRLSLGIEHFDDEVLELNGRAHHSAEIVRAWDWIRRVDFPNTNVDLIAGMVGETWDKWRDTVRRTIALEPDSITIYQMELPFNTLISHDILAHESESPVADWDTKRAWLSFAADELAAAGYAVSSAYTWIRDPDRVHFHYRDHLWHGCDLLATGVASFGHVSGVHYQNLAEWSDYLETLEEGRLPLGRGMAPTAHQRLIRELILQLKTGRLELDYFRQKFGTDVLEHWSDVWREYEQQGYVEIDDGRLRLTRAGLLRADGLLPAFFEPQHQGVRYT